MEKVKLVKPDKIYNKEFVIYNIGLPEEGETDRPAYIIFGGHDEAEILSKAQEAVNDGHEILVFEVIYKKLYQSPEPKEDTEDGISSNIQSGSE